MFMGVYVEYGPNTECTEEEPSAASPFEMCIYIYIYPTMKDIGKREREREMWGKNQAYSNKIFTFFLEAKKQHLDFISVHCYADVTRMCEERWVYRVLVGKPEGRKLMGRPRRR